MNAEFEFHSVGQGLFYSGCVGEDGNAFRFVYDCGGRKRCIEHEVNSYIGKLAGKGLDLIVLSHLHEDHINGVMDLLRRIRDSGVPDLPRVVMPYSNGSMNLLYEMEFVSRNGSAGFKNPLVTFYKDPIKAIKGVCDCEIFLIASDPNVATEDAVKDDHVFEEKGIDSFISAEGGPSYVLKDSRYSNVFLCKSLSYTNVFWRMRLFQPDFDPGKYERFRRICDKNKIRDAADVVLNKSVLGEMRGEGLGLNDSCVVIVEVGRKRLTIVG